MKTLMLFVVAAFAIVYAQDTCIRTCPRDYNPVCATYIKTYANDCEMKADACKLAPQGMHLLSHTTTVCTCDRPCPFNYAPLCATDNKTYNNQCMMNVEACKVNKWLEVHTTGACPSPTK